MMKSKTITSALVCLLALALLIVPAMAIPEDADYGVYRNGQWIFPPGTGEYRFNFGMSTDVPVVYGDLAAVYRGGTWIIKDGPARFQFGTPTDKPFYYDGKPAVFRDGLWIIKDGPARFNFGTTGDKPVAYGDYGAVFRNGQWIVRAADNSVEDRFNFGLATDLPVVWYDGRAAVYRDGTYIIRNPGAASERVSYGTVGDKPVTVVSTEPVPLEVVSVEAITNITVSYGTAFADIGLPENVTATLSDESTMDLEINWSAAEADYDGETAGTYALEGELVLPTGVTNPAEVKAAVNVIVEPEDLFEVATVEALDATTLNVTFADGTVIEEADLEDQIIQVRADLLGAESMDATYVADSLDTDNLTAEFALAGEDELEDAVTYLVSADWASFDEASFVAKIAAEYVASFIKVTEDVVAGANATVYFDALNQYGEAIDVAEADTIVVTGTLNGMPLTTGGYNAGKELEYVSKSDNFTANTTLAIDDVLRVTIKNKDGTTELGSSTLVYTVIEGDDPVLTTFTLAANTTSVAQGDWVRFTVTARDQYNSPFDVEGKVRYVIDGETAASDQGKVWDKQFSTAAENVEIAAFYQPSPAKNDAVTIEVLQGVVAEINTTQANLTVVNNVVPTEANIVINEENGAWINFTNTQADIVSVPADRVAFEPVDTLTIEKVGTTTLTGLKVSTARVNQSAMALAANPNQTFTVNATLLSDDLTTVLDFGLFDVTSMINTTVTDIELGDLNKTLRVGDAVNQTVVFKNAYGELIDVGEENGNLSVNIAAAIDVEVKRTVTNATTGEIQYTIEYSNTASATIGDKTVQLEVLDDEGVPYLSKTFTITVGETSGVKTIEFADDEITVKKQDNFTGTARSGYTYIDDQAYAIMNVTFKNQDGSPVNVNASWVDVTTPDFANNLTLVKLNSTFLKAATTDNVKAIGVYANDTAIAQAQFKVDVTTDSRATGYVNATGTVNVDARRNITAVELTPSEDFVLTIGEEKVINISLKDQYGDLYNSTDFLANISVNNVNSVVSNSTVQFVDWGKYNVTLTGDHAGSGKTWINATNNHNDGPVPINTSVTVTVEANVADLAVPTLVSGKNNQAFECLNFSFVGDMATGNQTFINLSSLVDAGANFSRLNETAILKSSYQNGTVQNITNNFSFTWENANKRINLTAKRDIFTTTTLNLTLVGVDNATVINVTSGATGDDYTVYFSRSDSPGATPDEIDAEIEANIIDGSAWNLDGGEDFLVQDFTFKVDGDLAQNTNFRLIIDDNKTVVYPTAKTSYSVSGNAVIVSVITTADQATNPDLIVRMIATENIPSGTEITVRAIGVDTTTIAGATTIGVEAKRMDTGNSDEFEFNVGTVVPGVTTVFNTAELQAALDDTVGTINLGQSFALTDEVVVDRLVTLDLKTFTLTDAAAKGLNLSSDGATVKNGKLALSNQGLTVYDNATLQSVEFVESGVLNVADGKTLTISGNTVTIADTKTVTTAGIGEIYGGSITGDVAGDTDGILLVNSSITLNGTTINATTNTDTAASTFKDVTFDKTLTLGEDATVDGITLNADLATGAQTVTLAGDVSIAEGKKINLSANGGKIAGDGNGAAKVISGLGTVNVTVADGTLDNVTLTSELNVAANTVLKDVTFNKTPILGAGATVDGITLNADLVTEGYTVTLAGDVTIAEGKKININTVTGKIAGDGNGAAKVISGPGTVNVTANNAVADGTLDNVTLTSELNIAENTVLKDVTTSDVTVSVAKEITVAADATWTLADAVTTTAKPTLNGTGTIAGDGNGVAKAFSADNKVVLKADSGLTVDNVTFADNIDVNADVTFKNVTYTTAKTLNFANNADIDFGSEESTIPATLTLNFTKSQSNFTNAASVEKTLLYNVTSGKMNGNAIADVAKNTTSFNVTKSFNSVTFNVTFDAPGTLVLNEDATNMTAFNTTNVANVTSVSNATRTVTLVGTTADTFISLNFTALIETPAIVTAVNITTHQDITAMAKLV